MVFKNYGNVCLALASFVSINSVYGVSEYSTTHSPNKEIHLAGFGSYFPRSFFSNAVMNVVHTHDDQAQYNVQDTELYGLAIASGTSLKDRANSNFSDIKQGFIKAREEMTEKINVLNRCLTQEKEKSAALQAELNQLICVSNEKRDELKQIKNLLIQSEEKNQHAQHLHNQEKENFILQIAHLQNSLNASLRDSEEKGKLVEKITLGLQKTQEIITVVADELHRKEDKLNESQELLCSLTKELAATKQSFDELSASYNEKSAKDELYADACKNRDELAQRLEEVAPAIELLQSINANLKNTLQEKEDGYAELTQEFQLSKSEMLGDIDRLSKELQKQKSIGSEIKGMLDQALSDLEDKNLQNKNLVINLQQVNQLVDDTQKQLFASEEALTSLAEELLQTKEGAANDLNHLNQLLSDEHDNSEKLQNKCNLLVAQIEEKGVLCSDLTQKIEDLNVKLESSLVTSKTLEEKFLVKANSYKELEENYNVATLSLRDKDTEINDLTLALETEQNLTNQLQSRVQSATASLEQHAQVLSEIENELVHSQDQNQIKDDELTRLLDENDTLTVSLEEEITNNSQLKRRVQLTFEKLAEYTERTNELENELAEAQTKVRSLKDELIATCEENDKFHEKILTLNAFVLCLEESSEELKNQLFDRQGEVDELQKNYAALETHMQDTVEIFGERLRKENSKVVELESELNKSMACLKEQKRLNSEYVVKLENANQAMTTGEHTLAMQEENIEQLKAELLAERTACAQFQGEVEELQNLMVKQQFQEGTVREELNMMLIDLERKNEYVENLVNKLKESKAQLERAHALIAKKEDELIAVHENLVFVQEASVSHTEELRRKLSTEEEISANMQKKLSYLLDQLTYETDCHNSLENQVADAKKNLCDTSEILFERETELGSIRNKVNAITAEYQSKIKNLEEELVAKTDEYEASKYQFSQVLAENDLMHSDREVKANYIANLENELKAHQAHDLALQKDLNEALDRLGNETQLAHERGVVEELRKKLADTNELAADMQIALVMKEKDLFSKDLSIENIELKYQQLQEKLEFALENLQEKTVCIKDTEERLMAAYDDITNLKDHATSVEGNLGKVMSEKETMETQIGCLDEKLRKLDGVYRTEKAEWEEKNIALTNKLSATTTDATYYKEYAEEIEAHIASLEIRTEDAEKKLDIAYSNIEKLEDNKFGIQQGYKEKIDSLYSQLIAEKEKAKDAQEQLENAYASNKNMSQNLKKQLHETEKLNQDYHTRIEERYADYEEMKRTYAAMQCEMANKSQDLDDMKRAHEKKMVRLQSDLDAALAINLRNDEHTEDLTQQLLASERRLEETYRQITEAKGEAQSANNQLAKIKDRLSQQIDDLTLALAEEKDRSRGLQEKILANLDTVNSFDSQKSKLKREREEAYRQLAQTEVQLAQKKSEVIALNDQLTELKRFATNNSKSTKGDDCYARDLERKLRRAEERFNKMEEELAIKQDELDDLHDAYIASKKSMSIQLRSLESNVRDQSPKVVKRDCTKRYKNDDVAEVKKYSYRKPSKVERSSRQNPRAGLRGATGQRY